MVDHIVEQIIEGAGKDLSRWAQVVPNLDDLSRENFERISLGLEQAVRGIDAPPADARLLWRALDSEVRRQKEHEPQFWSLQPDQVKRLEEILDLLPSPGAASKQAELFGWWPQIEGLDRSNENFRSEWHRLQVEAMSEILAAEPIEFRELVDLAENPYGIGHILAEWPSDEHDSLMLDWLDSDNEARAQVSRGYLSWRANAEGGQSWVEAKLNDLEQDDDRALALALLLETDVAITLLDRVAPELAARYWKKVNPWRVAPENARTAFERLLAVGRSVSALSLLEFTSKREEDGAATGFELADAQAALGMILRGEGAEPIGADGPRIIAAALDFVEARGADRGALATLEFYFFVLIKHSSHHPAALFGLLRDTPSEFVNLVKMATRGDDDEETQVDNGLATLAWQVLREWRQLPGTDGTHWDAQPDSLREWVVSAREMLAASGRTKIGDQQIGQILATGAGSASEGWPCNAVRDLLEELASREIDRGFYSSARGARGMWTKSIYEGGDQERELAQRFRTRAEECRDWRRTSRLLRAIADAYERESRNEDSSAKWDEDDA